MSKSFKDMKDNADKHKVSRIVETEQGHLMKRVFESGAELKYKDVEMSAEEYYDFNQLEDVPH
jgi:hypothetical protein